MDGFGMLLFHLQEKKVCYVAHDSTISFVEWETENAKPVTSKLSTLPLRCVQFLSENIVTGACFDYSPYIFSFNDNQIKCIGRADVGEEKQQPNRVVNKFQNDKKENVETKTKVNTRHKNVIHSFGVLKESNGKVTDFTTGALDGRILYWSTSDLEKSLSF